jgi:rod shape-determining protein MreC
MRAFRGRAIYWLIFFLLVIVILQLPFFSFFNDKIRSTLTSTRFIVDYPIQKAKNTVAMITSINDLSKENASLKEQLEQKEADIVNLEAVKSENEQLKKDLGFAQANSQFQLIPATVMSYAPSGLYQAIILDKGERDGIKMDQAVVSGGYLVGKVKKVSDHSSEVWLLSNRNLVIPVTLSNSQTVGILKGSIRGLIVENIPLDTKVDIGESIATSSLEGVVPNGIAVGKVEEIISSKEEIFITLRISSPINASNLTTVFIIK